MHIIYWEPEAWELERLGQGRLGSWAGSDLGPTSIVLFLSPSLGGRELVPT